ncbi:hypothetical protein SNE25_07780 [Mucilaginibacter sabulilitoris]|uniref:Right handed beta helix domain-containing protein n=1 Tax=Mucilaginibacter sabulilitoris TaxID=1173583 RepID=A0ABZ0TRM5_9SPHI|nr:hypothetical protein [Mucilaginibacter sabulilitoris]WPU95421.1 hypothetical protein SNE25_07780 [Mucilaginibacter sabulilitoris]
MDYKFDTLSALKVATGLIPGDKITLEKNQRFYHYDVITGNFADIVYRTVTVSDYETNFQVETPGTLYADDGYIIRLQGTNLFAKLSVSLQKLYFNFDMYDFDAGSATRKNNAFSALFNVVHTAFEDAEVIIELNPNLGQQVLFLPFAHNIGGTIYDWFIPNVTFKIGPGTYIKADSPNNRYKCRFDIGEYQQVFVPIPLNSTSNRFTFEPVNEKIYPQWFGAKFDYDAGIKSEIQIRFPSNCTTSGNIMFDFGEVPYIANRPRTEGDTYDNYHYADLTDEQRKMIITVPVIADETNDTVMRKVRMALWRHPKLNFFFNIQYIGQGTGGSDPLYPYIILRTTGNRTIEELTVDTGVTGVTIDTFTKQGRNPSTTYTDDYPAFETLFNVLSKTYNTAGNRRIFHVVFTSETGKSCALSNIVMVQSGNLSLDFFTDVYSVKTNMTGYVLDAGGNKTTPENHNQQGIGVFNFINETLNQLEPFGKIEIIGHNTTFDSNMDKNMIHYAHWESGGGVVKDVNNYGGSCVRMSFVNGAKISGVNFVNSLDHGLVLASVRDIWVDNCQFWNAATQNGVNIGGNLYQNWEHFGPTGEWDVFRYNDYSKSAGWRNSIRVTNCDAYYCADFGFGEFLGSDVFIDNCKAYYCGNFRQSSQFGKGGGFGCESSTYMSIQHKTIFSNIKSIECICRGIHIDGSAVNVINAEFDTIYSQYTIDDFSYDSQSASYKLVDINTNPPSNLAPFKAFKVPTALDDDRLFRECAIVLANTDNVSLDNITISNCYGYGIGIYRKGADNLLKNIKLNNIRIINCAAEAIAMKLPKEVRIENITINGVNVKKNNFWETLLPIDYGNSAIKYIDGTLSTTEIQIYIDGIWLIGDNPNTNSMLLIDKNITVNKGVFTKDPAVLNYSKTANATNSIINEIYMQRTDNKDIEITDPSKGLILMSPDGHRWRITVNNAGASVISAV